MLYVTAIDTLAGLRFHKSAYPKLSRQNRERFIRFLKEYACWAEGDLVSLPFLMDELDSLNLLAQPLGQHVTARLASFPTEDGGGPLDVSDIDAPLSMLLGMARTEKEEHAVHEYQHYAIFYRYRNSLVHESRQPGKAMEIYDDQSGPYYTGYIGDPNWYLAYPPEVFRSLLRQSMDGFRDYLKSNQIDPYSLVEDKARW